MPVKIPALVVSDAVSKVFISLAHDTQRQGKLTRVTEIMVRMLALVVSQLLSSGAGCSGPVQLDVRRFVANGRRLRAMAFAVAYDDIHRLASVAIFLTLKNQQYELVFQLVLIVARGIALSVGIIENDALLSIALFGATSTVCWSSGANSAVEKTFILSFRGMCWVI